MSTPTEQSCFSIIVRNEKNEIVDRGTGFFIHTAGFFITAGHVVKNPSYKYVALIDHTELPMDITFKEYVLQDAYRSELYMDLAFGKVSHQPEVIITLNPNTLQAGDTVELNGFNKQAPQGQIINLDDLDELDENIRFYNHYPTQIRSEPAVKVNKITGEHFIMANVYPLEQVMANIKGLSGGPIMHNDSCIGIVNNTQECLRSTYIIEQLSSAGIAFTTL